MHVTYVRGRTDVKKEPAKEGPLLTLLAFMNVGGRRPKEKLQKQKISTTVFQNPSSPAT